MMMEYMLKSICEISKWNTLNDKYLGAYYKDISSLSPLTDKKDDTQINKKKNNNKKPVKKTINASKSLGSLI